MLLAPQQQDKGIVKFKLKSGLQQKHGYYGSICDSSVIDSVYAHAIEPHILPHTRVFGGTPLKEGASSTFSL